MNENASTTSGGEIVVFEAPGGEVRVEVRLERETVWLTQQQMAELFGRERSVVTKHVSNIFREGELDQDSNVQSLHIAGSDKPVRLTSTGQKSASHMESSFVDRAALRKYQKWSVKEKRV